MHFRPNAVRKFALLSLAIFAFTASHTMAEEVRMTPLVSAVQNCSPSVVSLRGRKTVPDESATESGKAVKVKQVNGMGTGVVIDPRGYILTNYHVVEGVKRIEVSTNSRYRTVGKLLAHDPATDLAILKIDTPEPLPVIKIGSSEDLMLAETVAAVGNAYGYEQTVTRGIISQLGRTVQVNENQIYRNLIQTDASINPGNSGGPLLNLEGDMIGINVAVRIGAQGIAFAIPVNDAMKVAADLMSQIVAEQGYHGLQTKTSYVGNQPRLIVENVEPNSPAAKSGVEVGDEIVAVNGMETRFELDLYRSLLNVNPNSTLKLAVNQAEGRQTIDLKMVEGEKNTSTSLAWDTLGLRLTPVAKADMVGLHPNYNRGLRVTKVRTNSIADDEGIMPGDILVAMHGWKTETIENLAYILDQSDIKNSKEFMFYILRDKEPFWGQMRIAKRQSP